MFAQLSDKLNGVFANLRDKGKIREEDLEAAVREIRLALLEADVHFSVVKDLLARIKVKILGDALPKNISLSQYFFKVVQEELIETLGGDKQNLKLEGTPPHIILMVGLQGSGKTTTSAKLANHFKKKGRRPFLVPADFNRPAAVEQLKTLAKKIDVPIYDSDPKKDIIKTVRRAVDDAKERFADVVIVDTAGRLHVDDGMMKELQKIQKKLGQPHILFVADAMTGQEAVNVAKSFHETLNIDGVILTKMDGDAKGGAALSIQAVARCPIHFVGMGEKIDEFEPFFPDRLVSRLLDRGDILSLIEKVEEVIDVDDAKELEKKLKSDGFDLNDFLKQMKQMKKMGSLGGMMKFIPGMGKLAGQIDMNAAEKELKKKEAIIQSMTPYERSKPKVLNGSRRARIAKGSGTHVSEINRFMKEFEQMKKMMKKFKKGGMGAMQDMMRQFGR